MGRRTNPEATALGRAVASCGGCCTKASSGGLRRCRYAQNFIACDREQELLLPPNLREWLPEDHLVWFVLATIEELDLSAFYGAYRGDGHGRAAHEPG